jgi:RecA-family ATPase
MTLHRIEDWDRILGPEKTDGIDLNKSSVQLDREVVSKAAMSGYQWHNNMLRLVASWVAKGITDNEIHTLAAPHTLADYTVQKTQQDVQTMIDGARNKGFDQRIKSVHLENNRSTVPKEPIFERLDQIELRPIQYLVDELVPENSLVEIFGDPGSAKSFLGIDVACSVATGTDFQGFETTQGPVLYIAGEGRRGVVQRSHCWFHYHNLPVEGAQIYISKHEVGYRDPSDLEKMIEEIDCLEEAGNKPKLTIIDTLARNFGGGDENATKDMSEFINGVCAVNNRYGCATIIIHHSGLSDKGRARGNSSLKGALDAEFQVTKNNEFVYFKCTKMKDGKEPEKVHFILEGVQITNRKSEVIDSAVLVKRTDIIEKTRIIKSDLDKLKNFKDAYKELYGEYLTDDAISLQLDEWREYFYKKHHGDKLDTKRQAYNRCRKRLLDVELLTVENDVYTYTPPEGVRVRDIIKTCPGGHED